MTNKLPTMADPPPRWVRSAGGAGVRLIRNPKADNKMAPVLSVTDAAGRRYVIELTPLDVRDICRDTVKRCPPTRARSPSGGGH